MTRFWVKVEEKLWATVVAEDRRDAQERAEDPANWVDYAITTTSRERLTAGGQAKVERFEERKELIAKICAALEVPERVVMEMWEAERPAREEAEAHQRVFVDWAREKTGELSAEVTQKLQEASRAD